MTKQKEQRLDSLLDLIVNSQDYSDRNEFHQVLLESELFSPKIINKQGKSGLAVYEIDGKKLLVFYTTKRNNNVKKPFVGIEGEYALQMILDNHDFDGIYLGSESGSILVMLKAEISRILTYTKTHSDAMEIDRLIADFAKNNSRSKEDHIRFNNLFYHGEFYASIENKEGQPLMISLMNTDGHNLALFYTKSDNSQLSQPFAGMSGKEILEMVIKMPDVDGVALVSSIDEAWFGFEKQEIPEMIKVITS